MNFYLDDGEDKSKTVQFFTIDLFAFVTWIVFLILKVTGTWDIPWFWVWFPLWIVPAIVVGLAVILIIIILIIKAFDR